jgi:hypothetical protein
MAWVFGGKKFGQYTYEHWFDDIEVSEENTQNENQNDEPEKTEDSGNGD